MDLNSNSSPRPFLDRWTGPGLHVATDLVQFVSLPLILFGLFIDFSHPPPPHFHVSSLSRDLSVKNNIFFWILISHRPYCITTTATTHKKNIRHQQFHKKNNNNLSLQASIQCTTRFFYCIPIVSWQYAYSNSPSPSFVEFSSSLQQHEDCSISYT